MTSFEKRENNRENWVGETKTGHMKHKKKVGGVTPRGKDSKWKIGLSCRPKQQYHFKHAELFVNIEECQFVRILSCIVPRIFS